MSFKYAATRISDYEWLLERGVSTPIRIFMNQKLYDASEEEMWQQATWATSIPSVKAIFVTPDGHVGKGVPVGVVVATEEYIAPCAAGYDINCFTKDTKVVLTDNRKLSFEELIKEHKEGKDNYCFSLDEDANVVIAKIENPRKTNTVDNLVKITLDNNEEIICTLDEIFYTRENKEILAKDLVKGQSLMPLYLDLAANIPIEKRPPRSKRQLLKKYIVVYNPSTDNYVFAHYLADEYNIQNKVYRKKHNIRHHKNFNKLDNDPTNIKRLPWKKHWSLHSKYAKKRATAGEIGFKKAHKLHAEFYSKMASENMTRLHQRPGFTKKCIDRFIKARDKYIKSEAFYLMTRNAGKRGKKYLIKYNTSDEGKKNSSKVAHRKYQCLLCRDIVEGGFGIFNHFKKIHNGKTSKGNVKRLQNHKVINVEFLHQKHTDVYCMTTKYHNFALAAGVFVHNCGMASLKTKLNADHIKSREIRRAWIDAIEERISLGAGVHRVPKQIKINEKAFKEMLQHGLLAVKNISSNYAYKASVKSSLERFERTYHQVNEYVHYEKAFNRSSGQLSSLGGGNHFIELQQDENKNVWIMIHTGSRGYGHQIATDFFNEGLDWWNSTQDKKLSKGQREMINFPIDSDIGKRYLNAMNQAANFALVNRFLLAQAIIEATEEVFHDSPEIYYEISHNLVQPEGGFWVHRKGATRALSAGHYLLKGTQYETTGHPVLIPGSMGTASAILQPTNSQKSFYSINHGCGRALGRKDAKRRSMGSKEEKDKLLAEGKYLLPDQKALNKEMDDLDIIYNTRDVPIDECLHCYKDIDEVLDTVEGADLAKVKVKLYPRAVIKGND